MTAILSRFIRNTPPDSLNAYFKAYPYTISEAVNWNEPPKKIVQILLKAVIEADDQKKALLLDNAERFEQMTDELGQSALLSVVADEDFEEYERLEGEYARAVFVFLKKEEDFRKAEQIRYSDNYRKNSRMWDAFKGTKDIIVSNKEEDKEAFRNKIASYLNIKGKIKVEIFAREKSYEDGDELEITHVMVYYDDFPKGYKALDDNTLVYKTYKPAIEMAISYEPKSGSLEVIAKDKESREEIARIVSETLFGIKIDEAERITLKQYEISKFLKPYNFPTDPEDKIESVKVLMLKLKPDDDSFNKIMLEVANGEKETIWSVSKNWFDKNDPLSGNFKLSEIRISIKFNPDSDNPRGKTIPINIATPNRCDLKEKTRKERLIGNKYLKEWGILKEI